MECVAKGRASGYQLIIQSLRNAMDQKNNPDSGFSLKLDKVKNIYGK